LTGISIVEREMTETEFARMNSGFDEHTIEHGNPIETSERFGFVVMDGEMFVGCSSGLAYRNDNGYSNWFFITDLFIERTYRKQGLGAAALRKLEERVRTLSIKNIWTWTAAYEAPGFYKKQGYEVFCELEDWYSSGHSRVGLRKALVR
jgi:GNAT superfamily N-acetyltransferase